MTKEEWKQVEEWWGTGVGHVSMEIDGYSIFLRNYADKEKMTLSVMVYVNDTYNEFPEVIRAMAEIKKAYLFL